ncbi:immunoglobulin-like and fibronectin type III domain-containing protein 1 isoform 1-T2 [Phaethornis superciliosus]
MSGHREEIFKKSSVPGVIITQFVKHIPEGCSTPDFVQKPVSVTLQEGKNAVFRAVVKGVPAPEVKWTRTKGEIGDPARCEILSNTTTNEFVLQIKNLTASDSDLYRCCAVNEYGEAACSAGLRIIQVGFKRKSKYVPVHPVDVLRKQLEESRKMLKKRAPRPKQKPLSKEQVWQLLLHADRRDYEKICLKYGIVDFRGMLRKLQELKRDTESEQEELLHSIRNFEHITVDKEGKATFSLEMDLKDKNSQIYLLKDGVRLKYGTGDEFRKHNMRQIGKKYYFVINDVRPEDAGVYQVRVENVPVFSTALDPESIPVRFQQPLSDVRCLEKEDAVFECILRTPCHDAVWMHKTQVLQNSDKHQISVSPDGLTHRLTVKNAETSDNGMYMLSTGTCSSKAWLLVEYAKGKRKQDEGDEGEESNWLEETLPDKDRAKKPRHRDHAGDDHLMDTGMGEDGWARNGQLGSEGHSIGADGSHGFYGKEGLHKQFSGAGLDGDLVTNDGSALGLGGKSGLGPFHGKDSVGGRAGTGDEFGGAGDFSSVDGRGGGVQGAVNVDMDGEGVGSRHDKDGDTAYRAGFGGVGGSGPIDGSSVAGGLDPDLTGVGGGKGGLFPGTGAGNTAAGMDIGGGMKFPSGKDDLLTGVDMNSAGINREGQKGTQFGTDGQILHSSGHLDQTGKSGLLYGPGGSPSGDQTVSGAGASSGEMGALYGPDGRPIGAGAGRAGVAGAGGVGAPYGKDGLPAGAGFGGAGAGGVGAPYGKDGLPAGAVVGGAGAGGVGALYGKDGLPAGAGVGGAGAGGAGALYGKDGLPAGAGVGGAGAGGAGALYGKDGLPAGAGVGGAGAGGAGALYGKDGLPAGAGVGAAGGIGSPYGQDGLPAGAGVGGAAGGIGSPYGQDGLPAGAGVGGAGAGGVGAPYGQDGLPAGAGVGGAGAGGVGAPYGQDGLPAGAGVGGAGVAGAGGMGSSSGKDGLPAGAGAGGAGVAGAGGAGSPYGKDGSVAGAALGGEEGMGSQHSRDASLGRAQGEAGGDGFLAEGDVFQGAGSPSRQEGGSAGARAGVGAGGRLGADDKELHSVYGKEGVGGAFGQGGLDSHPGKFSTGGETGKGTASDLGGSGKNHEIDSHSGQGDAMGKDGDLGGLGSFYDKRSGRVGRSAGMRNSGGFGQGASHLGQTSGLHRGPLSINQRIQEPDLELKANDLLKNTESTAKRRNYSLDNLKAPRCFLNKGLHDISVLKGESAELSFTVNKHDVTGTWFKDGLKLTSMDGVIFKKEGLVHKLIINKVDDIHAGKYRFQGGDIKTEAYIFVEDPPQVDQVLLQNLTSIPTVAKAGQKIQIKIPFQGRVPIGAVWLKDRMELMDDTRIRVDKTDTFTMLSISSCERKDCGDYKVRLKNDSGVLEINLKVVVVDKPQPPVGPIKIIENSGNSITIAWKPPKDDGGKPVQGYIVESQQVGKDSWVALGETPRSCTTFTTNKVEQDTSYYFRVRAVNAEGISDALESEEVKADSKASPGAPDPPEIVSTSRDSITISWKAPRKAGSSRIVGYMVQKRQKGSGTWLLVTKTPIAGKELKVTNLKKGLQYEFRVAAVNAAGTGDASEPSEPAFAQDSSKSVGRVLDLKVSSSDSSSITLTWKKPEVRDGSDVRGYEVEMRPSKSLSWTICNALPIEATTYTVKGLQAKEKYFLRVTALSDSGSGEAAEIEACTDSTARVVSPRFLIDDTVKSSLIVKAGDTIRVTIPFEAAPNPEVTWLKDELPYPKKAAITTKDDTTRLLIRAAEFTDSGIYTIELRNGLGEKETFTFQVQVKAIPQRPGPIKLEENVLNTVTVTWEPSASEKWESDLYYTVLKRESEKGLWQVVGDLIYNNKFTFTRVIPGQDYYFRVVAKNSMGASGASETVKPWRIKKPKAQFEVRPQKYREVNQNRPPKFLVPLKPHVVTTGSECRMSCAVGGHPPPRVTWYRNSKDLSKDPDYFCINDLGVCSLVIPIVTKQDEGQYVVEATNELGCATSKAFLTIKDTTL